MLDTIAKPFGYLLMVLYEFVLNYGLAIIIFAFLVRLILLPFMMKSKRGTMQMARLQPKMKELEKKHGANKQKYQAEVAKLYQEEKINPASGCLWGLLPFPIMLALYRAVINPLTSMMGVPSDLLKDGGALLERLTQVGFNPEGVSNLQIAQTRFISENFDKFADITDKLRHIDYSFLGVDLSVKPQWTFLWSTDWSDSSVWVPGLTLFLIPIVSGLAQFLSSKIMNKMNPPMTTEGQGNSMQTMLLLMPLMSVYIGFVMPAALGIYWTAGSVFYTLQDVWLTKRYKRIIDAEEAVKEEQRRIRDAELEAKRLETERRKAENATERNRNTSKRKLQATDREEQKLRAAEYNKKDEPEHEDEPSRVGHRRYARGRAYDPYRYDNVDYETYDEDSEDTQVSDEVEPDLTLPDVTVDDYMFDGGEDEELDEEDEESDAEE